MVFEDLFYFSSRSSKRFVHYTFANHKVPMSAGVYAYKDKFFNFFLFVVSKDVFSTLKINQSQRFKKQIFFLRLHH